jgi:hypothetical protein
MILVACSTRKNHRKFSGPPFRKEALKQGALIITGPFNNFHPSGINTLFLPFSTEQKISYPIIVIAAHPAKKPRIVPPFSGGSPA